MHCFMRRRNFHTQTRERFSIIRACITCNNSTDAHLNLAATTSHEFAGKQRSSQSRMNQTRGVKESTVRAFAPRRHDRCTRADGEPRRNRRPRSFNWNPLPPLHCAHFARGMRDEQMPIFHPSQRVTQGRGVAARSVSTSGVRQVKEYLTPPTRREQAAAQPKHHCYSGRWNHTNLILRRSAQPAFRRSCLPASTAE